MVNTLKSTERYRQYFLAAILAVFFTLTMYNANSKIEEEGIVAVYDIWSHQTAATFAGLGLLIGLCLISLVRSKLVAMSVVQVAWLLCGGVALLAAAGATAEKFFDRASTRYTDWENRVLERERYILLKTYSSIEDTRACRFTGNNRLSVQLAIENFELRSVINVASQAVLAECDGVDEQSRRVLKDGVRSFAENRSNLERESRAYDEARSNKMIPFLYPTLFLCFGLALARALAELTRNAVAAGQLGERAQRSFGTLLDAPAAAAQDKVDTAGVVLERNPGTQRPE